MLNGWITLDKPLGMSSAFAVDKVKKQLRTITKNFKIGHAGTLDPLASGVLVLAVGEATKLIQFAMDAPKEYIFTATWGEERDTDDGEGLAVATSETRPTTEEIEALLPRFTGPIQQVPPPFSAIKVGGQRSYDRARAGEAVELKARDVTIFSLFRAQSRDLPPADGDPSAALRSAQDKVNETIFLTHCSKGTYIRSLARDMGRELGCYGYVSMLRRTRVGKLTENDAISLEKLSEMVHKGDLGFLTPPQAMLDDILAISLNAEETKQLKTGGWLPKPPELPSDQPVACLFEGYLVAIARIDAAFLKPVRVFNII